MRPKYIIRGRKMEISTSILNVKDEDAIHTFYRLETVHTDYFHIDIMDGKFVKKDTVEAMKKYADCIKNITNIPLEVHLMVDNVKKYVDMMAPCEPSIIMFHIESTKNKQETIDMIKYIKDSNCKVGLVVNPETSIENVFEYLPFIHQVMVMTVHPGEGGQELIPETIEKVRKLKNYIDENNYEVDIEVDGGITLDNLQELADAGANIASIGTYMINAKDYKYTMNKLKSIN